METTAEEEARKFQIREAMRAMGLYEDMVEAKEEVETKELKQSTIITRLNEDKEEILKALKSIEDCLEKAKKLSYSEGDVVYHKEYGACIVRLIDSRRKYHGNGDIAIFVNVFHQNGEYSGNPEEFVPQTELTKGLYD